MVSIANPGPLMFWSQHDLHVLSSWRNMKVMLALEHDPDSYVAMQVSLLFFYTQLWGFFPMAHAVFTFPNDHSMLIKERPSRMYRLSSYFVANNIVDLPMQLCLPAVFVTITYWMGGLKANAIIFIHTLSVLLLYVVVSQGLGLAIGALVNDQRAAATMGSVVMTLCVLANGFYVQNMAEAVAWTKRISPSYYCFKLLLGSQFKTSETYPCEKGSNLTCFVGSYPVIEHAGIDKQRFSLVALTVMLVVFRLIAYFALVCGVRKK